MPELPEVETIVRGLAPHLVGRRILNAEFRCRRICLGEPSEIAAGIIGRTVSAIRRHGKFIVVELLSDPACLSIHLGMTGKLLLDGTLGPHTHGIVTLDRGVLLYDDVRQFGRIELTSGPAPRVGKLGPDPLAIDNAQFTASLRAHQAMLKPLLLNQNFLRGLGNIYTDEALFRAGLHPRAIASRVSKPRAARLHRSICEVLMESIESGGSSVSDYVDAGGRKGSFQLQHRVYGREDEPCPVCSTPIRRILVGQRGTHFCPRCQRR
jgi:formamidopyrimidine-DNA glycosylase